MTKFEIRKATKAQAKLRMAIFGPSGSGKTMSALRIAHGLGKQVGVIDTERGSASKYSDRWPFDVIELDDASIESYVGAMHAFADAGHDVLIVDSISHAWEWVLDYVDKLAKTKYKGNKWSAWSEGTPLQQKLVDAILAYPGHVIATMRSKTEWVTEQNDRGKSAPKRVGTAPRQRDGVEYEFDVLLELDPEGNTGRFIKDRTGKFQDRMVEKPDEDLGGELAAWLSEGEAPPVKPSQGARRKASDDDPLSESAASRLAEKLQSIGVEGDEQAEIVKAATGREVTLFTDLTQAEARAVWAKANGEPEEVPA